MGFELATGPVAIPGPTAGVTYYDVSVSGTHACARTSDGSLYCFDPALGPPIEPEVLVGDSASYAGEGVTCSIRTGEAGGVPGEIECFAFDGSASAVLLGRGNTRAGSEAVCPE